MAVPQQDLPVRRKLGRKGDAVRIRRKVPIHVCLYCGTVITVPYICYTGVPGGGGAARPTGRLSEKSVLLNTIFSRRPVLRLHKSADGMHFLVNM